MHWTLWLCIIGSFGLRCVNGQGQRVAPGVPPQHYQQPVQQMHQVPQHAQQQHIPQQQYQQQVPVNQMPQQQVPIQQVQQQMPVQQQVPVQHMQQQAHQQGHQMHQQGHHHDHPQQILNAANIAQEKAHIAEHMEVPMDTSKMSDQELQFHYFKMHDADNNNKLDGCELIKSLIHWHEQGNKEPGSPGAGDKLFSDNELVSLIDPILSMDDTNKDGFIDYPEFVKAQQNAAASGRQ